MGKGKGKHKLLQVAGLSERQFENYMTMFVDGRRNGEYQEKYFNYKTKKESWVTRDLDWNSHMVLRHLADEIIIGLPLKRFQNHIMLDIDNHDSNPAATEERLCTILKAFDAEPLIYLSSASRGFRVIFFLDRYYHVGDIAEFARSKCMAKRLKIVSGQIEILTTKHADRLPFGRDNYIVDPSTLEPLWRLSKGGMIDYASQVAASGRLTIPEESAPNTTSIESAARYYAETEQLINEGLHPDISTNEAVWKIVAYLSSKYRLPASGVESFVIHWLHEKHNENSASINKGDFATNEKRALGCVRSYKRAQGKKKSYYVKPPVPIPIGDVKSILTLTDQYKTQQVLFNLFSLVRANGITFPSPTCAREVLQGSPAEGLVGTIDDTNNIEFWLCNIPSRVWKHELGLAKSSYCKQRAALCTLGSFAEVYPGSHEAHYCACYAFRLPSAAASTFVVQSLNEALVTLFQRHELKRMYSPYRAEQICRMALLGKDAA